MSASNERSNAPTSPADSRKQAKAAEPDQASGAKQAAAVAVGIDAERREQVKADRAGHQSKSDGGARRHQPMQRCVEGARQHQRGSNQLGAADHVLAEHTAPGESLSAEASGPAVEAAEDFLRLGVVGEFVAEAVEEDRGVEDRDGFRRVLSATASDSDMRGSPQGRRGRPSRGKAERGRNRSWRSDPIDVVLHGRSSLVVKEMMRARCAELKCRLPIGCDARGSCDDDEIDRLGRAFDLGVWQRSRMKSVRRALLLRALEGGARGDDARVLQFGVLFELGREIDGVADHGEFQTIVMADDAMHDLAVRDGDGDAERRHASARAFGGPIIAGLDARAGTMAKASAASRPETLAAAEADQDAVAQIFVDAAAGAFDDRHEAALVLLQQRDDLRRRQVTRRRH